MSQGASISSLPLPFLRLKLMLRLAMDVISESWAYNSWILSSDFLRSVPRVGLRRSGSRSSRTRFRSFLQFATCPHPTAVRGLSARPKCTRHHHTASGAVP
eukprot:195405-Prorocentrum_minimum.AAC.1